MLGTLNLLLAWLLPWRPAFLARAEPSGLRFFVHRRDLLGRHVAKYGAYEPELTAWISARLLRAPRGIVIDVGANLGWHAVHAAKHDAVEAVIAFEPDAFNAWLLERNLAINRIDNVIVNVCAVGMQNGLIRLHRYKGSNCGRHSVLRDYGFGSRVVPMTDIDSALDAQKFADRRILLLKVDTEGYEPRVIAGATRTLARTEVVITEYSPALSRDDDFPSEKMLDQLHLAGFIPNTLAPYGRLTRLADEDLRQVVGQRDIIWIRDEDHD